MSSIQSSKLSDTITCVCYVNNLFSVLCSEFKRFVLLVLQVLFLVNFCKIFNVIKIVQTPSIDVNPIKKFNKC